MNRIDRSSAYEYGKLAITSLITTTAGALVALLAFLGQAKVLSVDSSGPAFSALYLLGGALGCALLSSILAYLNQAFLAFWGEVVLLLRLAILSIVLSFALLCMGGVEAIKSVKVVVVPSDPQTAIVLKANLSRPSRGK